MSINPEDLRLAMRHYPTGVCVVTSRSSAGVPQGMTANSFVSVSLVPPRVTVTMSLQSRTYHAVTASGVFGVTMLAEYQVELANRFAGRTGDDDRRFDGVDHFTLQTGAPLLAGGTAWLDCEVVHSYAMENSTLFVGAVVADRTSDFSRPMVYFNRTFHRIGDELKDSDQ